MVSLRQRKSFHEAGHCCAAIVYGIPVISVTITNDTPHLHRARYCPPAGIGLECMTTLCLAGPAAEEFFCGPITDGSDRIDIEMARRYLARRFDLLRIEVELGRARDAAGRLVKDQQQRIRAIAAALLERGTLSGEDIAGITSGTG
jgi:hypothetical protein